MDGQDPFPPNMSVPSNMIGGEAQSCYAVMRKHKEAHSAMPSILLDDMDIKLPFGSRRLNILCLRREPEIRDIPSHTHSGFELHYNYVGHGWVDIGGTRHAICPGMLYITGPDVFHAQHGDPLDPMGEECINLELQPGGARQPDLELDRLTETLLANRFWIGPASAALFSRFECIWDEATRHAPGYLEVIRNELTVLLIHTFRSLAVQPPSARQPKRKDINDERRLRVDLYLERHWRKADVGVLARHVGMTERQLNRVFHAYFGMPFTERVLSIRLHEAMRLLQSTDMPIRAVAEETGFSDSAYFCRQFRRKTGYPPRVWRTNARSGVSGAVPSEAAGP